MSQFRYTIENMECDSDTDDSDYDPEEEEDDETEEEEVRQELIDLLRDRMEHSMQRTEELEEEVIELIRYFSNRYRVEQ